MHDPPETGIFAEIADVRTRPPAALPGDPASWLVVETPSRRVALKRFGDVQVLQDEARQIDLVVHGELYDGASLPGLISSYQDVGASFVKECNGLFSILLVDRRRDRVVLATDRLRSKPLHVRRVAGRTYVSSKLRHLVTCDSAPDRAGVAWYLCNGVVHMDGTVLAEVSRVPRASCCTLSDGGQRVTRYWNHEFTDEDGGRSFEQLRGDLADLLVACVKKRPGGEDECPSQLECRQRLPRDPRPSVSRRAPGFGEDVLLRCGRRHRGQRRRDRQASRRQVRCPAPVAALL